MAAVQAQVLLLVPIPFLNPGKKKGHKSLCEEEQAETAVTQDLKEGSSPTPENLSQTGFVPLPMSPLLRWASLSLLY